MLELRGDIVFSLPVVISAVAPVGALIPAVHVDAADLRLPLPWLVAAGALAAGVPVATALVLAGETGLRVAAVTVVTRLVAAAWVVAVLSLSARISRRGMGGGDLRVGALMGLALGLRLAFVALAASCVGVVCGAAWNALRRAGRAPAVPAQRSALAAKPIPFGPALLFGFSVATALKVAGAAGG